ncbi:MAG: hypothetical protein KKF48_01935 [Nanoarchaeota archaeon]|nr:hypothetical protein [Nanoarchaeota archaeon]MBU1027780.1 hypothetical protein [Nanoarchaeota archaeon]
MKKLKGILQDAKQLLLYTSDYKIKVSNKIFYKTMWQGENAIEREKKFQKIKNKINQEIEVNYDERNSFKNWFIDKIFFLSFKLPITYHEIDSISFLDEDKNITETL